MALKVMCLLYHSKDAFFKNAFDKTFVRTFGQTVPILTLQFGNNSEVLSNTRIIFSEHKKKRKKQEMLGGQNPILRKEDDCFVDKSGKGHATQTTQGTDRQTGIKQH